MNDEQRNTRYLSAESYASLQSELENLKNHTIPEIAKRIDEAKQQGDLSENAEYHQAREDMSWAQGRLQELEQILQNSQIISKKVQTDVVAISSVVTVEINNQRREYTIVGPQEINLGKGHISNESPIGEALIGHRIKDVVEVNTPAGIQKLKIIDIK